MKTTYALMIFAPDETDTPGTSFESDHPFPAVAVGDLIHLGVLRHWGGERTGKEALEAIRVEHFFSLPETHQLHVFTKYVPNTPETRLKAVGL
jgi:hypothetical protein